MNVEKELAALQKMTVDGLRTKFAEVFGELAKRAADRGVAQGGRAGAQGEQEHDGRDFDVGALRAGWLPGRAARARIQGGRADLTRRELQASRREVVRRGRRYSPQNETRFS